MELPKYEVKVFPKPERLRQADKGLCIIPQFLFLFYVCLASKGKLSDE